MNALRGQRFEVDFSDDEYEDASGPKHPQPSRPSLSAFIGDVQERTVAAPPSAPKMKSTPTGFPEHKKRARVSAFKQQRSGAAKPVSAESTNAFETPSIQPLKTVNGSGSSQAPTMDELDRRRIDEDNNQILSSMSAAEIEEERQELLSKLDPSLIEMLLKRSNLDDGRGDTGTDIPSTSNVKGETKPDIPPQDTLQTEATSKNQNPQVIEAVPLPKPAGKRLTASKTVTFQDDDEPREPVGLQPASEPTTQTKHSLTQPSVHFPSAPAAPELDPSDPSFLENLHSKYFPNLPIDPSKLAWMAPIPTHGSPADQESPYYPASAGLNASALRFDFRGGILPPRIARAMPTNKGLHHHGEAPEAAGYTVPELARLARSAFPAQRCIAFQTLGRLLYRLGRGEWGDADSEVTKGLWRCVEEGKVVETLQEAAGAEGGHRGSKVYAIEAVWLWQKGGGKVWKAN